MNDDVEIGCNVQVAWSLADCLKWCRASWMFVVSMSEG